MYEDDGAGFDPITVVAGKGLNNIMQRAKLLNGSSETDSAVGKGMRMNLQFNI
jgi:signal transduction histidine kinase